MRLGCHAALRVLEYSEYRLSAVIASLQCAHAVRHAALHAAAVLRSYVLLLQSSRSHSLFIMTVFKTMRDGTTRSGQAALPLALRCLAAVATLPLPSRCWATAGLFCCALQRTHGTVEKRRARAHALVWRARGRRPIGPRGFNAKAHSLASERSRATGGLPPAYRRS